MANMVGQTHKHHEETDFALTVKTASLHHRSSFGLKHPQTSTPAKAITSTKGLFLA